VHSPWEVPLTVPNYPAPVVDHAQARADALAALKACNAKSGPAD
jgi:deoxyribodipyrimidine photolyase